MHCGSQPEGILLEDEAVEEMVRHEEPGGWDQIAPNILLAQGIAGSQEGPGPGSKKKNLGSRLLFRFSFN